MGKSFLAHKKRRVDDVTISVNGYRIINKVTEVYAKEDQYPASFDFIRIDPLMLNRHPHYTRVEMTRLMNYRFPINSYEFNLMLVKERPESYNKLVDLWTVFYSPSLKMLVYRIPFFQTPLLRRTIVHKLQCRYFDHKIIGWSPYTGVKGYVKGSNYWMDGAAIIHETALRGHAPQERVEIPPKKVYMRALELDDYRTINSLYLVDHPEIYPLAPVLEVTSSEGYVSFYDSRYFDLLRSSSVFAGCLINRVDDLPFFVSKRGRIIPMTDGPVVLAVAPLDLTETGVNLWKTFRYLGS